MATVEFSMRTGKTITVSVDQHSLQEFVDFNLSGTTKPSDRHWIADASTGVSVRMSEVESFRFSDSASTPASTPVAASREDELLRTVVHVKDGDGDMWWPVQGGEFRMMDRDGDSDARTVEGIRTLFGIRQIVRLVDIL